MSIERFLLKMKNIQNLFLKYIDCEYNEEENYLKLKKMIDESKIQDNPQELLELLHILINVSSNHHRVSNFFEKIIRILKYLKYPMKNNISKSALINIFKDNKRMILFLYEEKIIDIKDLPPKLSSLEYYLKDYYYDPEENKKRKIGENDYSICKLIREDMIDDFVSYIKENNISLSEKISYSSYETNKFLDEQNRTTLIEYAAFFGSIQIFEYLLDNKVEMTPSLWLYAIHSNNPDLFNILEKYQIEPEDRSYKACLQESIKCYHIDISNYIINRYFPKNKENAMLFFNFGLEFHNFAYIQNDFLNESFFNDFCEHDYLIIVNFLLQKIPNYDINEKERKRNTILKQSFQ